MEKLIPDSFLIEYSHCVYETSNLTNGKKYIGRSTIKTLSEGYIGSNEELLEDQRKKHRFRINKIHDGLSEEEAKYWEAWEIKNRNAVNDPNYYNKKYELLL